MPPEGAAQQTIQRHDAGSVTVLRLPNLDSPERDRELKTLLATTIEEGRFHIVLDMSQVSEVTSGFFGTLISITHTLRTKEGCIKLATLQPGVASAFKLTRLSRIYEIFDEHESAVRSFG